MNVWTDGSIRLLIDSFCLQKTIWLDVFPRIV